MYPLGRWKPEPQSPHEIAPGVFWLRMPLPFALDHINLWLLEDGDSWVVVDTGLGVPGCHEVWRAVLSGPLIAGKPVSRIFVTHYHPDHIGLAGWLAGETGAPLLMSRTDYLMASFLMLGALPAPPEGCRPSMRAPAGRRTPSTASPSGVGSVCAGGDATPRRLHSTAAWAGAPDRRGGVADPRRARPRAGTLLSGQ
ncbi:MBL fold metallo-hydrolase [Hankyongella ginsenosidimutans]|uniref:MBL fold metallo-hydrolase n=1 Tax=Hankyongella ginsenosidimutans TaxID=1763828 RepID=A0A4D7BVZ9_9SPHN|nr:MBL fold metallo-hydrolase [Hankyongella ginsenosidimutans]QCI79649.1 MBL fold metallo-hydrolase [Hankyongella ginsenosidimutans]